MTHSRRAFLTQLAGAGVATSLAGSAWANDEFPRGKAEQCVLVWLGGGACHIDTWDPKRKGDAKANKPGSYYDSIDSAIPGTQVCQHLPRCAAILDRFNIVRTVHHELIDEHAVATNFVHTGRPTSGTVIYPSIGSIVAHKRGAMADDVPAYVLIGFPNVARGPGFLGAQAGYIYLTDTHKGPSGFTRESSVSNARQSRREKLLSQVRADYLGRQEAPAAVRDYAAAVSEALRLSGPEFQRVFQLDQEPSDLRQSFGGEFGQRCLLTRRLLQAGVRFVEVAHNLNFVNGTGWDTHREGQLKQHLLIQELDQALSSFITDLERHRLLDRTLVVVATEFGRPAGFDTGGGRGHHGKAFSIVLAGGGLKNGVTIGTTNELGMEIVDRPVSIPDLHATIHCALGIDPSEELYANDRPVPITDHGSPIRELFT